MAVATKSLFRATKQKKPSNPNLFLEQLPKQIKEHTRDPLDFDPTPADAVRPFLASEIDYIRAHGNLVWENAIGAGDIARVLIDYDFKVIGSDITDRGYPCNVKDYFTYIEPLSPITITNPPYNQINARDGHGRWLRHSIDIGVKYIGLLLNSDWAAARINGLDELFSKYPPSREYQCCWKIDFRGGGSPPQRNSWFVWDTNTPKNPPNEWRKIRLFKDIQNRNQEILNWL